MRHNGNPYSFRRNDVTEAAKLYYNMKNYLVIEFKLGLEE